jgi:peptidoglycan/xylan/chitin deacetylase (PgdA/CDA1 family)
MTWTLVSNIKGIKGDKGDVDPTQNSRFELLERLVSESGSRVENLVVDPLPVNASTANYGAGRASISQAPGYGRTICTDVGATSLYPLASTGTGAETRFAAVAGDKVASRVEIYGHPTLDMGVTLSFSGYRWDGTTFVPSATAMGVTSGQLKVPAGTVVTFEAFGVVPASDITHVLPLVTWRRWAETYPQAGDYIYWRKWSVQTGADAASASPVLYTDGTQADSYWLGAANNSASVALTPRNEDIKAARRSVLVDAFTQRRGGRLGTNGVGAVALRFDHHLDSFVAKVLPLLQQYGLPFGQALNPQTVGTGDDNRTWAQIQSMCLDNGGEVWNHGGNHLNASGVTAITQQVVGSLDTLKANLPGMAVEGWMPPGLADGGYDGYSPMDTLERHYDTFAGRLILSTHAAVNGYIPGSYRGLDATNPIGRAHMTMDTANEATVKSWINGAKAVSAGLTLMLHPNYLDTTGYMTTADLGSVLAFLAAERDAGRLVILTPSGLQLAAEETAYRQNLAANGSFKDGLTGWANTSGWTVGSGSGLTWASTSTGTPLTQTVGFSRTTQYLGGPRELVFKVRALSSAVVRTAVTGAGITATKDHTLTGSTAWVEVRKPLTLPLNLAGDITLAAGRVSGGGVDITDVRLQTI